MTQTILDAMTWMNGYLWATTTFYLLMGAGILFTIWTKFCQFRAMTHGVQVVRGVYDDPNDTGAINHFQALSAALSATIGLGNIGGVALAIGAGGPGALFWMWIIGFLGMALKTVEITLAMMYRNTEDPDNPHGGAMWVIDKTLGAKGGVFKAIAYLLGGFFAATCLISTITGGNMFQSWNVAELTVTYFDVPRVVTGIVLAATVGLVIVGGIKRIGNVAGRLVPLMCMLYLMAGFAVLAMNFAEIPAMLALIVRSAFTGTEASGAFIGGSLGFAFSQGLRRALFSNEAGQGSAPMAHAAAKTDEPAREGIVGGIGPFIDTICICTLTALVILLTGTWNREPVGAVDEEISLTEKVESEADSADNNASDETTWTVNGPTSVSALPPLPKKEPWTLGDKIFLLAKAPGTNVQTKSNLVRIGARVIAEDEVEATLKLEWSDVTLANSEWSQSPTSLEIDKQVYRDFEGAPLTAFAFDRQFPGLGKWLVTLAAWLFAISTMISWSYYGEQAAIFLFGKAGVFPYKLIFLMCTAAAPVLIANADTMGNVIDFGTGFMLWANMPIVLMMGYLAVNCLSDYYRRLDAGEFHPHVAPPITDVVEGKDVEK